MFEWFNVILTYPLFNLLVALYNTIGLEDLGVAIIALTILIRLVLWPLSRRAIRAQRELQELQPKIKEVQNKYRADRERQAKELMALYKEHHINPFGGCLPILVQIPILIALYRVFLHGTDPAFLSHLYSFVSSPGMLGTHFLTIVDLASPSIVLAVIAGILQFIQSKMISPRLKNSLSQGKGAGPEALSRMMTTQAVYVFPVVTVLISLTLPAGLPLYWATTTLFTIVQQFEIMGSRKSSARHGEK